MAEESKKPALSARTSLALKIADAHVAVTAAKEKVDIESFKLDQLIRQLNNTPEDPTKPGVTVVTK